MISGLTGLSLLAPEISLSQSNQEGNEFSRHYFVDNHEIRTRGGRLVLLSDPCFFDGVLEDELIEGCPFTITSPLAVLPAPDKGNLVELYRERHEHISLSYRAQEFILIMGFPSLLNTSEKVVSIDRNSQLTEVTIESNQDSSQNPGIFFAEIIQINLGYLEPGEYHFKVRRNHNIDGVFHGAHENSVFLVVL